MGKVWNGVSYNEDWVPVDAMGNALGPKDYTANAEYAAANNTQNPYTNQAGASEYDHSGLIPGNEPGSTLAPVGGGPNRPPLIPQAPPKSVSQVFDQPMSAHAPSPAKIGWLDNSTDRSYDNADPYNPVGQDWVDNPQDETPLLRNPIDELRRPTGVGDPMEHEWDYRDHINDAPTDELDRLSQLLLGALRLTQ